MNEIIYHEQILLASDLIINLIILIIEVTIYSMAEV